MRAAVADTGNQEARVPTRPTLPNCHLLGRCCCLAHSPGLGYGATAAACLLAACPAGERIA